MKDILAEVLARILAKAMAKILAEIMPQGVGKVLMTSPDGMDDIEAYRAF